MGEIKDYLQQVKRILTKVLGDRFNGLILYGSTARGDNMPDSDIDLLVLLNDSVSLTKDLKTIIKNIYSIQLDANRTIHALPVNFRDYQTGEYALYRNIKKEGVII